jgi:hypothetical protein
MIGATEAIGEGGAMTIAEAQREMRLGLMGGFMGQLVSGLLWLVSAALATWSTPGAAIGWLVVAGFFIFPLTKLGLWAMRHRYSVSKGNPLNALGAQTAFVLPLCLPLVGAATLYRLDWFFPAFMVLLGAHYLPFATVYGMRMFYVLAAVLFSAGVVLGLYVHLPFAAGAWFTAAVLMVFAVWGGYVAHREAERFEAGEFRAPASA